MGKPQYSTDNDRAHTILTWGASEDGTSQRKHNLTDKTVKGVTKYPRRGDKSYWKRNEEWNKWCRTKKKQIQKEPGRKKVSWKMKCYLMSSVIQWNWKWLWARSEVVQLLINKIPSCICSQEVMLENTKYNLEKGLYQNACTVMQIY